LVTGCEDFVIVWLELLDFAFAVGSAAISLERLTDNCFSNAVVVMLGFGLVLYDDELSIANIKAATASKAVNHFTLNLTFCFTWLFAAS
jgi:hypothetical protein